MHPQPRYVGCNLFFLLTDSDNENSLGSCGHTFCALCIRECFRAKLVNNLSRFRQENDVMENMPLPKTSAQRRKLTRLITSYGGDSAMIFTYQCPQCRGIVKEAPVMAYQLRSLLSATRAVLSDANDDILPTVELPVTSTFFNSLFE
jgi:hypothetical protein